MWLPHLPSTFVVIMFVVFFYVNLCHMLHFHLLPELSIWLLIRIVMLMMGLEFLFGCTGSVNWYAKWQLIRIISLFKGCLWLIDDHNIVVNISPKDQLRGQLRQSSSSILGESFFFFWWNHDFVLSEGFAAPRTSVIYARWPSTTAMASMVNTLLYPYAHLSWHG